MFCPNCKEEYRDGFTTCADCDVELVAELPVDTASAYEPERAPGTLVPVFETHDQGEIAIIKSALEAEGIIFHFSGESVVIMGARPIPARLMVASDRREEVVAMLNKLELL